MLKEIFNKEEKSEEEKTKEINQKTLIYLIIFVVGISFLFINTNEKGNGNNTKPNNENTITITKEDIVKKLDNIKDNYSLDITEKVNDEIVKLKIDTDGKLTSYISESIDSGGYIFYNNEYFVPGNNNDFVVSKNVKKSIAENIYDLDLVKSLTNYCEFIDNNNCKIKYSDYLKEYNYKYKTTYEIEEDDNFLISFTYSENYITKISYDYTLINKIINNSENKINYIIRISNINKNDFSDQFEYFNNLIKKKN